MIIEKNDKDWMQLAIQEAKKGVGLTSPNPCVGAVIVKNNQLLGKGWHKQAGKPHAEREAIADVLLKHKPSVMKNATIYVTLEPCSSHGRTPPCTQGIIDAGITRVVYGAEDPNPNHRGSAKKLLEKNNIEVVTEIEKTSCELLVRGFSKVQQRGLPWVILKSAISLDGKITRPPREGQWLTSPESREEVQKLRFESDAILTGGNTLRIDNPALTLRCKSLPQKQQPWRMIVTRGKKENLAQDYQVFTDEYRDKTIIQENGNIKAGLKKLANLGCNTVLVEAGGTLMSAVLNAGLADEIVMFYAPLLTGGPNFGIGNIHSSVKLINQEFAQIGNDVMLRAIIKNDTNLVRR